MDLSKICDIVRHVGKGIASQDHEELAAFLRICAFEPLSARDGAKLTRAIIDSGDLLELSELSPIATIHSTGAPGSLTTVLSPVLAAASGFYVPVFSISGKVAGAIDSLSCIPGYDSRLSLSRFRQALTETRLAHVGHGAADLAPADRVLWELRGKTGTKKIPELIAASLLSKQLASGAAHGAVDIRVGPSGNAGDDLDQALKVGFALVAVARELGVRVDCIFSDFRLPQWKRLGRLDTLVSVWEVLKSPDKYETDPHIALCQLVAACACHVSDPSESLEHWRQSVKEAFASGKARLLFERSVEAHGAREGALDEICDIANQRVSVAVSRDGQVIDARELSRVFEELRSLVPSGDSIGLHIAGDSELITVLLPPGTEVLSDQVRRIVTASLGYGSVGNLFESKVLLYDGAMIQ